MRNWNLGTLSTLINGNMSSMTTGTGALVSVIPKLMFLTTLLYDQVLRKKLW